MALNYCLRCASLAVSFLIIWGGTPAIAADSTFVGVLALAAEEDVATELQLSPEVRTKLAALIEQRENEVGDLALEIKDLPAIERTAKLAPFVAESEKLGLALLTDEQKVRLGQIRLSHMGMASLAEPGIGSQLGLSAEQKDQIARLLAEMATEGAKGNELDRLRAKANYERQLKAVLSREQQAKWEGLAGRGGTLLAAAEPQPAVERPAAQPAANQPSSVAAGTPAAGDRPIKDLKDVKLTFTFDTAPWKDVIDWLAKEADLSLQVPSGYPAGTFNYRDTKSYSLREAMDVMNRTLFSFHGYLLVRRERLLVVWNLEEPIPHDWLVPIAPKELDDYGEFEFVRCLFQLTSITAEEAEAEATKLKSTAGTVVTLSRSRQLYVTDMAGKVRAIRDVIDPPVDPNNLPQIAMIPLGNLDATTVQNVLTSLLANRNPPVQITVEPKSNKLVVNGSLRDLEIIKTTLDQLSRDGAEIKVFKLKKLDPSEAMLHINSLFVTDASPPKIQADSINMRLIFFGSKSQISLVEKYLVGMGESLAVGGPDAELTQEVKSNVRVIPLTGRASRNVAKQFELTAPGIISNKLRIVIPPELASDTKERESFAIPRSLTNSAPRTQAPAAPQGQPSDPRFGPGSGPGFGPGQGFGPGGFGPGGFNPGFDPRGGGPGFPGRYRDRDRDDDRDRGEGDDRGRDRDRDRGPDDRATQLRPGYPLRMLPLEVTQFVSEEQAEEPATAEKKAESADAPPASEPAQPADPLSQRFGAQVVASVNALLRERDQNADGQIDTEEWKAGEGTMPLADADLDGDGRLSKLELCLQLEKTPAVAAVAQPAPTTDSSADAANQPLTGDEVVVIVTPTGWIIRSNDTDALDKLEEYLSSQIPPSGTKEFSIFYLKFAKAENAAALLQEVLGGAPSSDSGGGGGLMGDLAAGMMGNMMGNMFGNMFGGSGGFSAVTTSGNVSVIPDPRLNALFVQASPSDLDTVEKLLQLIDQSESPDPPQTMPGPRFIVVKNANVEDVATTVRQVYASKLTAEGGGQQRQPSPEDFIRAIAGQRGGRRGGGGGGSQQRGEEQKMTIGVDVTSNTLIVSAPDYLFNEVKSLVTELDSAAGQREQTVSVVKLERTSPDIVAQSLSSVLGSSMSSRGSNSTSSRTTSSRSGSQNTSSSRTPNFGGGGGFNPGGFGGGGGFNPGGFGGGGGFNPGGFGGGGGFNPGGFGGGGGFNPGGGFNRGGGFGGFGGGGGSRGGRGR